MAAREDFLATSDPALQDSADRAEANLLSYRELYLLWERQQWSTQDLDFSRDRVDWHERIDPEERFARMYGLSAFFIGEQKVADELGPIMRAAPTEEQRIFLCTQIADEARHVRFFDRFYAEVGVLEGTDDLPRACAPPPSTSTRRSQSSSTTSSSAGSIASRRAPRHRDPGRGDHALPHGHRGDPGTHRPALHHRLQHPAGNAAGASSRASRRSPATSTATSPSAFASSPTWRARTIATSRRSSGR